MNGSEEATFQELHPYGLTAEQLSLALWVLGGCLLLALLAFLWTAWRQIQESGMNSRSVMGMKPRKERMNRREIIEIVKKQQKATQD
jgi:hypothetical protein